MVDYTTFITTYNGLEGTWEERLALIEAMTIPGPTVNVPIAVVEGSLSMSGTLSNIEDWLDTKPAQSYAKVAAREMMRTIASPHLVEFQTSSSAVLLALSQMLGALANEGLIDSNLVTVLLSLPNTVQPWYCADFSFGGAGLESFPTLETLLMLGLVEADPVAPSEPEQADG